MKRGQSYQPVKAERGRQMYGKTDGQIDKLGKQTEFILNYKTVFAHLVIEACFSVSTREELIPEASF